MAYQVSKTSALQTAIKAGVDIAVAELNAGIISTHDELVERVREMEAEFVGALYPLVEADNANMAAQPAPSYAKPSAGSGGGGASSHGGGSNGFSPTDAAQTVLTYGAFKGLTIEQIFALTPAEATTYSQSVGKDYKRAGKEWLKWASENDDPKAAFIKVRAEAFLAAN